MATKRLKDYWFVVTKTISAVGTRFLANDVPTQATMEDLVESCVTKWTTDVEDNATKHDFSTKAQTLAGTEAGRVITPKSLNAYVENNYDESNVFVPNITALVKTDVFSVFFNKLVTRSEKAYTATISGLTSLDTWTYQKDGTGTAYSGSSGGLFYRFVTQGIFKKYYFTFSSDTFGSFSGTGYCKVSIPITGGIAYTDFPQISIQGLIAGNNSVTTAPNTGVVNITPTYSGGSITNLSFIIPKDLFTTLKTDGATLIVTFQIDLI